MDHPMVVNAENSTFLAAILIFGDLPTKNIVAAQFCFQIRIPWTLWA